MWASNGIKKVALIGTSCSGKTTLCHQILGHLKEMGVSCDGVLQQDRRFAFDRVQLELNEEAQYYFICNQIMREIELTLRGHAEVLVSDRSVLDLYAYYVAMYSKNPPLFDFVKNWLHTYTCLYYLEPLPYINDKARPDDVFRLRVDKCLKELMLYVGVDIEIVIMPREKIMDDLVMHIGKQLKDVDLAIIAQILKVPILIGGSYAFNRATKYSDVDVYVLSTSDVNPWPKEEAMEKKIQAMLGVKVEVHLVPNAEVWNYLKGQGFKLYGEEYDKF